MKTLPFDEKKLREITAKYPTPFHLYDEQGILDNLKELQQAFAWNEGFCEYFAVKATPNPMLMKLLAAQGCGMDCSSYTELMLCNAIGIPGEKIMFSSNTTPAKDFRLARSMDAIINYDDITHIDFLEKNGGIPETACCRFNPGGEFKLGNTIMGNPGEAKYGMTRDQLTQAFCILMQKGVKRFGLHAFLASNTTDPAYYPALARLLFQVARELHEELGASVAFINLSGGVGIPYRPEQAKANIGMIGENVRKAYEEVFAGSSLKPRIFTELGRFITGPYGYLVTTAIHSKDIYKQYIGLDACAANLMRPAIYGAYHHITVMGKENAPADHMYDVTGSLCENNDKFAIDRMLPKIDIGDLVVLHDTGAHGFSMGYNYNGKLRSAEVLLKCDGTTELIRRAETPEDYFSTLDFLGIL